MFEAVERRVGRFAAQLALATAISGTTAWLLLQTAHCGLVCGPVDGPTAAARAVLVNLHRAQLELRDRRVIDRDGDGKGEFGTWNELVQQHVVGAALLPDPTGCVSLAGYHFSIWLPTRRGWLASGDPEALDGDACEARFCAYAWPDDTHAPRAAFYVDERGDVYQTTRVAAYRGLGSPAHIDAALPSSDATAERSDRGHVGRDGNTWVIVQ